MANFTLWSTLGPFFFTTTGPISGYLGRGNVAGGGDPVWVDTVSPTPFQDGVAADYTVYVTAQDWLGEQQLAVPVTSMTFAAPFTNLAGLLGFSTSDYVQADAVLYWRPSTTSGAYDLAFESFTDRVLNVPTTTPAISLSGTVLTLETGVANVTGYTYSNDATSFVYSYSTAASSTTENVFIQVFNSSGGANSPRVEVAAGVADDATSWYISQSNGVYSYVHSAVNGSATGVTFASIDTGSGAIGASFSYFVPQATYSKYFGIGDHTLSNGDKLLITQGISNGANVLDVTLLNSSFQSLGVATEYSVTGTSAIRWSTAAVYDPATGKNDYDVLVYDSGNQVHLELLGIDGKQIGSDFIVPGLTSFSRLHALGSRVEIEYYSATTSGLGEHVGYIYDTAQAPYTVTLDTSSELYVGTPFSDAFTDGSGTHAVNGGGGSDTLTVNYGLAQVNLAVDAAGHINLVTPISNDRLERFTTVTFTDATLVVPDGATTTGNATPGTPAGISLAHAGTTLTVGASVSYANPFSQAAGTTLDLAGGYLLLSGNASFVGGTVSGTQDLYVEGASTTVTGLKIGGTLTWIDTKTVSESGGTILLGDAAGNTAILDNTTTGTFAIVDNSGIAHGSSAASRIVNYGLFEKTGGAGMSVINATFQDAGKVAVAAGGTLAFAGPFNSFAGPIGGGGTLLLTNGSKTTLSSGTTASVAALSIAGGSTAVTLAENLSYAGTFSKGLGTTLSLTGGYLLLSGHASLGGVLNGTQKFYVEGASTTVAGLTIGGTVDWIDTKSVVEAGGNVVVGDASANAAILNNYVGATYSITDNSGIARGAATGSYILNQGTLQKTGGAATSIIGVNIVNNTAAAGTVAVTVGTLELGGTLTGNLALKAGPGTTLILDKSAAAGAAASYTGANATLQLSDAQDYRGTIAGFTGGEKLDLRSIGYTGTSDTPGYSGTTTAGTLTVTDGTHTATLAMLGNYSPASFHLASDNHGGTAVTFV